MSTFITVIAFLVPLFSPNRTNLCLIVSEKDKVVEFSSAIDKLVLKYDTINLLDAQTEIVNYKLDIYNHGNKPIHEADFDTIQIKLSNNKFLSKPKLDINTKDYFKRKIKLSVVGDSIIQIPSAIFNSKSGFRVEFLSLEKKELPIKIKASGTIIEQGEFILANKTQELGMFSKAITGNFAVQCIRFFLFLFILLSIFGLFNIVKWIRKLFSKREISKSRKTQVNSFKSLDNYQHNLLNDIVYSRYIEEGDFKLVEMDKYLSNFDKLVYHIGKFSISESSLNNDATDLAEMSDTKRKYFEILKIMKLDGYIHFVNNEIKVDRRMKTILSDFLSHIK